MKVTNYQDNDEVLSTKELRELVNKQQNSGKVYS